MAQWIDWGNGHDGSPNAISGTVNTYASCTGTATQTVLTTALSAGDGDQILIHQTQHATESGKWEVVKVLSDAGATLNLYTALVNSYSTGAQCVLIPQYTGGTLSGAVTATAWNGSVGGIIALMSNGDLTISGSLISDGGFRGGNYAVQQGQAYTGESSASTTLQQSAANGNGGGGGKANSGSDSVGSGGGGGNGTAGGNGGGVGSYTAGVGGGVSGNAGLTNITFGGAGGGSGVDQNGPGGNGGKGGAIIFIFAKTLTLSGTMALGGTNGVTAVGGGGGGAGGSCLIKCQSAVLGTNKITASGGIGGQDRGNGGNGGVGRIRCDYYTSVTGTTSPALSSAEDPSLNVPGNTGAFFQFL